MTEHSDIKMNLYKTAWSPLFEKYVGIKKVRKDDLGEYILDCHLAGEPEDNIIMFRVHELERFCL